MKANNPANVGRYTPISLAAGLTAADTTQLVTTSYPDGARQLIATLSQVTRVANTTTPWIGPRASPEFNGPTFASSTVMRARIRWGAGGVTFQSLADFPLTGGTFGVVAQSLAIDVVWYDLVTGLSTPPTFAAANEIPFVGAFLADGTLSDREPLRWTDPTATLAALPAPITFREYNVVPFAKSCQITSDTNNAVSLFASWRNAGGTNVLIQKLTSAAGNGLSVVLDVPPMAVALQITNVTINAIDVTPVWRIGMT